MSLPKYSFVTILSYALVFFGPVLFAATPYMIQATTVFYIAGAIAMVYYYLKQPELLSFEHKKIAIHKIVLIGLGGIIAAILLQNVAVMIESLFSEVQPSENTQSIMTTIIHRPMFMIAATVCGPIMEEFVFRRALVGIIGKYTNLWVGMICSAILFSLAHMDNHLLVYVFLGLFFSLIYQYTGKIWTSIITHVGMNTLVIIIQLLVYYSGISVPT